MRNKNLLPPGFRDDLSPTTESEHFYMNAIISIFNKNGFQIVKPPLVEYFNKFDDKNTFIINEKKKNKKLKLRNDITLQVARIASSRFKRNIRPLKLCYYGEVVRNFGTILRPERQFLQVGAECIGKNNFFADIEILMLACQSLLIVGIKKITIDFSNPIFLNNLIIKNFSSKKNVNDFLKYVQKKDLKKSLTFLKDKSLNEYLKNIIECRGNLSSNIKKLEKLSINEKLSNEIKKIIKTYKILKKEFKTINFNIDLTENTIESYYTGLNLTAFARNVRGEIARGGRYITKFSKGEEATGFTCFMDSILRASSFDKKQKRIIVPFNTKKTIINSLQKKQFIIERFFDNNIKLSKNYNNKIYTHILINNKIRKLKNA